MIFCDYVFYIFPLLDKWGAMETGKNKLIHTEVKIKVIHKNNSEKRPLMTTWSREPKWSIYSLFLFKIFYKFWPWFFKDFLYPLLLRQRLSGQHALITCPRPFAVIGDITPLQTAHRRKGPRCRRAAYQDFPACEAAPLVRWLLRGNTPYEAPRH